MIWDAVTDFIAGLPEGARQRGQLLLASLAVRHSADGLLGSVLADPQPDPLLYLPTWGLADQDSGVSVGFSLAKAAAFEFSAAYLLYTHQGEGATDLAQFLQGAATLLFESTIGDDELFWETRSSMWERYKAILASTELSGDALIGADRAVVLHAIVGASVDATAGRRVQIASAVTHLGAALAIERDLTRLRADLEEGSMTIATVAARAAVGSVEDPDIIYLIAAGRRVPHRLLDLALRQARLALQGLVGSPRLSAYAAALADRLGTARDSLGVESPVENRPLPRGSRTVGRTRHVAEAIQHARAFLLADHALEEAKEVHRRSGLHRSGMTSTFAVAFPLEALARCGEPVSQQLEAWLEELASRSFSYYDEPRFAALDADTVGAVLRLQKYRSHGGDTSLSIEAVMPRVVAAVQGCDRIPVWLERPTDDRVRLVGARCAAVEANFLLGLLEGSRERFPEIGARPLVRLWSDFASRGTRDVADYVFDYFLLPMSRLLAAGEDPGDAARARLASEIEKRTDTLSPQTAAFLTMAALNHPDIGTAAWSWVEVLTRNQRHDGGWDAEPLFWVNGSGGGPEWFRSRTVTTGFCFEALSMLHSAALTKRA